MSLLRCKFTPQAWVNGYAIEVDPEGAVEWVVEWDDADEVPDDDTYASDDLRYMGTATEWVREWSGPFCVVITNREDLK